MGRGHIPSLQEGRAHPAVVLRETISKEAVLPTILVILQLYG